MELTDKRIVISALFLIFFLQAISLTYFLALDRGVPAWDQSWHAMLSIDHYRTLFDSSYDSSAAQESYPILKFAKGYYPPFYHLSALPMYLAFGVSYHSAIATNILFLIILIISAYFIGKRLSGTKAGLIAALLASVVPIYNSLMREYMIDFALCAMVAAGYCLLLYSERFDSLWTSIALGLVIGLGMLTKWTYAIYLALPLIYYAFLSFKDSFRRKRRVINALASLATVVLIMLLWYTPSKISSLAPQLSTFSGVGSLEGDPAIFSLSGITYYIFSFIRGYSFMLLLAFIAAAYILFSSMREPQGRQERDFNMNAWLIAASMLFSYIVFTALSNKDPRFIAPLMLYAAIVSGLGLSRLDDLMPKARAITITSLIILLAVLQSILISSPYVNIDVHAGKLSLINTRGSYPDTNPAVSEEEMLQSINATGSKTSSVCIIAESRALNDVNIAYYSLLARQPVSMLIGNGCRAAGFDYVFVGPIEKSWRSDAFNSALQDFRSHQGQFRPVYSGGPLTVYASNTKNI